jgi:hypothetical protein
MHKPSFPVYRKLANGRSFFRIDSATRFTEIQRIGRRCVVHEIVAHTYPEKVRIAELLNTGHHGVLASTEEEFGHWLSKTGH